MTHTPFFPSMQTRDKKYNNFNYNCPCIDADHMNG